MSLLKIYMGAGLFWFSGGVLLIILGLIPSAIVIAGVGLLSFGTVSAATLSMMTAVGIAWAAIGIPIALRGIAWFEDGLYEVMKVRIGITQLAQKGTNKIPLIGNVVKLATQRVI